MNTESTIQPCTVFAMNTWVNHSTRSFAYHEHLSQPFKPAQCLPWTLESTIQPSTVLAMSTWVNHSTQHCACHEHLSQPFNPALCLPWMFQSTIQPSAVLAVTPQSTKCCAWHGHFIQLQCVCHKKKTHTSFNQVMCLPWTPHSTKCAHHNTSFNQVMCLLRTPHATKCACKKTKTSHSTECYACHRLWQSKCMPTSFIHPSAAFSYSHTWESTTSLHLLTCKMHLVPQEIVLQHCLSLSQVCCPPLLSQSTIVSFHLSLLLHPSQSTKQHVPDSVLTTICCEMFCLCAVRLSHSDCAKARSTTTPKTRFSDGRRWSCEVKVNPGCEVEVISGCEGQSRSCTPWRSRLTAEAGACRAVQRGREWFSAGSSVSPSLHGFKQNSVLVSRLFWSAKRKNVSHIQQANWPKHSHTSTAKQTKKCSCKQGTETESQRSREGEQSSTFFLVSSRI